MNTIEAQIAEDHAKFHRHYHECLKRNARHLMVLNQSSNEEDMTECFDYSVSIAGAKVAVRNRLNKYLRRYGDFTIRSRSQFGGKTEIDKIREGLGDFYLFTWQTEDERSIEYYIIVDLGIFRSSGLAFSERQERSNGDGTKFISFTLDELSRNGCLVVASKF